MPKKYWLGAVLGGSVVVLVILAILLLPSPRQPSSAIVSVYPPNPVVPFAVPTPPVPLEEFNKRLDPYYVIQENEEGLGHWLAEQRANPDATANFIPFSPFPALTNMRGTVLDSMRGPEFAGKSIYTDLWLTDSRVFKGAGLVEHIFSDKLTKTQDFMIQMLLDGRPLQFKANEGAMVYSHTYTLHRSERYTYTLETSELPAGVHNLNILFFKYTGASYPDPLYQVQTGKTLLSHNYRVYVGDTSPADKVEFLDWSTKLTPNKKLPDAFYINDVPEGFSDDGTDSPGIPVWQGRHKIEAGKPVSYTLILNNVREADREYCLVAYLDYQVVPLLGEPTRACGIIKAGHFGLLHGTFTAPTTPGDHWFEVLQIDNPLLKHSYFRFEGAYVLSSVVSSGRVFFTLP